MFAAAATHAPLRRTRRASAGGSGRWIAGVCAGIAQRLGWRVSIVRLLWLMITVIPVLPGLPIYLGLWLLVPLEEREHLETRPETS